MHVTVVVPLTIAEPTSNIGLLMLMCTTERGVETHGCSVRLPDTSQKYVIYMFREYNFLTRRSLELFNRGKLERV